MNARRWQNLPIARQIMLLAIVPWLILFLGLFSYLLQARLSDLELMQRQRGELLAKQLAVASEFAVLTGNRQQLQMLLERSAKDPVVAIQIWDAQRESLASYENAAGLQNSDSFGADIVLEPVDIADALLGIGETSATVPNRIGHLELSLSRAAIISARNRIIGISLVIGLPMLGLAILVVWALGRRFARPVIDLTAVTVKLADGDLSVRSPENGAGEAGVLQRAINQMASNLERQRNSLHENLEQLEAARASAEQANQAKSEFLATMSHELRTPMNGALGMLELLRETPLSDQQQHFVNIAVESTQHLLTVVNDILDFSRIERGLLQLEKMYSSIGQLALQTADSFRLACEQKRLRLDLDIDPLLNEVQLLVDPARLRQILVNLLGNAIKFTFSGGIHVVFSASWASPDEIDLTLCVTDTGIGIPTEKQAMIFQAFRQGDGSTMRRFGGSGLGLAIVHKLCELMDADIHLVSAPGRGSSFTVALRTSARGMVRGIADAEPVTLPSATVLVVEDNHVNQIVVANMLKSLGQKVDTAQNGIEALQYLHQRDYDLVLMDCQMPEMDGYQATEHIRRLNRPELAAIPIIALTANAMVEDRERCLAAGMNDYLSKPVTLQMLREKLRQWLPPTPP